ncbi:hypothetical protein DUI87_18738 [Hirundo rustica rustica]|uniref:ribonuclease H n=1 Tax=Hirundo rustica rustica TaxID=333673 RepID=A0A3M0JWW6_HIRRU|nr:hypothetical protein DUI87_18738 [Hirundo rustica rustica]
MEQGIQCLKELDVVEIIFSEEGRFCKSPNGVQCTSQLWLRFARLGPETYSHYLATLQWREDDSSAVGLLRVEKQQVPIATATVHCQQYRTDIGPVIPIHEMICKLESHGVVSKAHSPFNSPIWPVRKSSGKWRLMVDYRALNEIMPPLSTAMAATLELQYELESKAAKWHVTVDIANAFFSIPLAAECRLHFAFTWRGMQYT